MPAAKAMVDQLPEPQAIQYGAGRTFRGGWAVTKAIRPEPAPPARHQAMSARERRTSRVATPCTPPQDVSTVLPLAQGMICAPAAVAATTASRSVLRQAPSHSGAGP